MLPIVSLLVIVSLSLLITKVATIALSHTGLTSESARFQARSAFTGVGFTTTEAEKTVNHPVRRRIVMTLMLLGNAGLVTAVSSLILTFVGEEQSSNGLRNLLLIVTGLITLWLLTRSRWLDRQLSKVIEWMLRKYTDLDVKDYTSLLHIRHDYNILEVTLEDASPWVGKRLEEVRPRDRGVVVLGINNQKNGYTGVPKGKAKMAPGDTLVLYGHATKMDELMKEVCVSPSA